MYEADFPASLIMDAAAALQKQKDICEVMPRVRLSCYDRGSVGFNLVCQHEDKVLNCGTGGKGCTGCIRKEEIYKASDDFGKSLGVFLQDLTHDNPKE